jgi:hypothetical protein
LASVCQLINLFKILNFVFAEFDIKILLSKYISYHKCTTSLMYLVDPNVC